MSTRAPHSGWFPTNHGFRMYVVELLRKGPGLFQIVHFKHQVRWDPWSTLIRRHLDTGGSRLGLRVRLNRGEVNAEHLTLGVIIRCTHIVLAAAQHAPRSRRVGRTELDRPLAGPTTDVEDAVQVRDGSMVELPLKRYPDQVILKF